jgi:hypothetical protein
MSWVNQTDFDAMGLAGFSLKKCYAHRMGNQ